MIYETIKLRQRTHERLDFYRNEDQTWDDVINELLDHAGAWRIEDLLKDMNKRLKEGKKHGWMTLEELGAELKRSRSKTHRARPRARRTVGRRRRRR